MRDEFDIPLTITASGFSPMWFSGRAGFHLEPTRPVDDPDQGTAIREWPFDRGTLLATEAGEIDHLALPIDAETLVEPLGTPHDAERVDMARVQLPFGAAVSVAHSSIEGDMQWHEARLDGVEPKRWLHLAEAPLYVAVDDADRLGAIRFCTPVPRPTSRLIRFRSNHRWSAEANQWFGEDGATGLAVHVHRTQATTRDDDPWLDGPVDAHDHSTPYEHVPSLDGSAGLTFAAGDFDSIAAPAATGPLQLPEPDERVDHLEARIVWPVVDLRLTLDESARPACARFDFEEDPVRWVDVAGLLIGLTADGSVAAIGVRDVEVHTDEQFDPMHWEGLPPEEQHRLMLDEIEQQMTREFAQLEEYAASPKVSAIGLADPPIDAPVAMRLVESPWGGRDPVGVQLEWGDWLTRMQPDGDPQAPLVTVRHERVIELDHLDDHEYDEQVAWLLNEEMQQAHRGEDIDDDVTSRMISFGPEAHERQMAELAAQAKPATIVLDGEPLAGEAIRINGAFTARADRDGRRVAICASGIGDTIPNLVTVTDLAPFVAGRSASDKRMLDFQRDAIDRSQQAEPPPPDAAATRARAQELIRAFEPDMHGISDRPRIDDPAQIFSSGIVDGWGGADAFRRRFELTTHLARMQPILIGVAEDGSLAHAITRVQLPRPDGVVSASMMAIGGDWWDHTPEQIREAATRQPPAEEQGTYELAFNTLLARQPDGTCVIDTDLLRLIDLQVGGIEQLLDSSHRDDPRGA